MKKYLITSALPYINGIKHLGNLVGSLLPSDVYARFRRNQGFQVAYICATDDHGAPAEIAALKANKSVEVYCNEMYETQKAIYESFDLSFDYFGRTASKTNHNLTQHLYHQLDKNGYLREVETEQAYATGLNKFLPDRYITGTCPHCNYERATGDQCENCTTMLDAKELINPRGIVENSGTIEFRKTTHLFLKQSSLAPRVKSWLDSKQFGQLTTGIVDKWFKEGIQDRSITRDLNWGVSVAYQGVVRSGFEGKVFYVWFDAPIGYMSNTIDWCELKGLNADDWLKPNNPDSVEYSQFMGKDNVPFHTLGFPMTLLGADESYKLVDVIKAFNWLNYYGGKFSTSQRRGIFLDQALELFPSDYWRWYLMANCPETSDSSFTWEHFQQTVNKDLADVLGNLVSRLLKFYTAKFGSVFTYELTSQPLLESLEAAMENYYHYLSTMEFRKASFELRQLWVLGNEYFQANAPWELIKTDPQQAKQVCHNALVALAVYGYLSEPFVPKLSQAIREALGLKDKVVWHHKVETLLKALLHQEGTIHFEGAVLVKKITDDEVALLTERFSGQVG